MNLRGWAAVLFLLMAGCGSTSGDGGLIAVSSDQDGDWDIVVVELDRGIALPLSVNRAFDWGPKWSPDGSRLAFTSDFVSGEIEQVFIIEEGSTRTISQEITGHQEIVLMAADGSDVERVTNSPSTDSSPSWSPDGTKLAFTSDRGGNLDVYVMDVDGSNVVQLTDHPGTDWSPSWSPDGTKLAFASDRGGNSDVYVMDVDGSNVVQLTDHPGTDSEPVWSPDGTRLAFASNRAGPAEVYLMDRSGEGLKRLGVQGMPSDWLSAG